MNALLITGGMGFIGSNFIRYLFNEIDEKFKIVNIDKLTYAGNPENLKDIKKKNPTLYKFHKIDICDYYALEKIISDENVDAIINFAAESHVDRSINNPNIFCDTNIKGTQTLLNLALEYNLEKFIQISTDEVYGSLNFDEPPFNESNQLSPNSPYSATKASADLLVKAYNKTYDLPVNITRCSNNYGPFQFPEKLIPLMINNALKDKDLPVYGKGINIRDWIYVKDHCRAIYEVFLNGKDGEIYNIGGDSEIKNINLVKKILHILGKSKSLIKFVKDRPGHDLRYAIDHSKITKELGWQPKISLERGLKLTIKWYLENLKWLENILTKEYQKYYEKQYGCR